MVGLLKLSHPHPSTEAPSITEEEAIGVTAASSPLPAAAASSAELAGCLGNGRRRGDAPRDGGVCHRGSRCAPAPRPRPLKVPETPPSLPPPPALSPWHPHSLSSVLFSLGNAPLLSIPPEPPHSRPLTPAVFPGNSSFQPYLWGPWHRKANLLEWGLGEGVAHENREGSKVVGKNEEF